MPRVKPACVRRVSIGESSGSCSDEDINNVPDEVRDRTEAHMCPRCQEQFESLHEFLYHKRVCDEKALQMGEERMHSDPEEMVVSGDEEMDGPNKRLEQVRRHRQDAENNNSLEDGEAEVPEADVPPVGLPFPVTGHVTLEALQNTKVAVAQFAATAMANNADNEAALHELAVLQSTLFTLQHQQVFQLQLIRQLQNQLSLTRRKDEPLQSPPPSEAESNVPVPTARSPSPPRPPREPTPATPAPPTSQSLPSTHSHLTPKSDTISIPKLPTSSPPMMSHPPYSSISSSLASSIITNNDPPPSLNEPNTLEMLQKRAQEVLDNASQGLLANNLADELAFRKSGKMSPYDGKSGGRNEPFFKHRCRYCGKVFGSDSALQIHIRSHTGERPFKCNVCGSRFTTKGNLKVHFQRHTAKFPHVKMNPNPIPEHLDKYHPPLLAQLSPGPIPGMPPHPLQFPPGGPAPFPTSLPLYRPPHHDLLPPRPLGDKPLPPHPLFAMREEQDAPADLSKPSAPSPSRSTSDVFKSEPQDEESQRDSSFEDTDRVTPKREPEENDTVADGEPERYPSSSPYDDCSMDSKYSNEDHIGRESPQVKPDPDQPENLSSKNSSISGPISIATGLRTYPSFPLFPHSPPSSISSGSITPFQNMNHNIVDVDIARDPVFYNSLLPRPGSNDNSWESLIEITKTSETAKLQELVDNIDNKLSDPNECIVCHRVLSCKSALQMHYRTHTGERPFRCKLCGRAFTTKGNLKTHMGVHRIKPPSQILHQCPVCHKKFADLTILHEHIRLHTGDRISFDNSRHLVLNDFPLLSNESDVNEYTPYRPVPPPLFPTPSTPGDRRADSRGTDDESGRDDRDPANREFDDDSDMKDRRTSPLSVYASASECEVKTITTTASLPSATGSESGRSARASPPSPTLSTLSTPPRLPHHSPLPSPPAPLAALGALGGSPFSPLGLAFPPAVRGNTTCNICYKTFACNSALEIHYRSHTKERPFKCTVCDRGFSTKSSGGGCRCGRRARAPRPPHATALDLWNAFVYPGNMKQHMLTHKIRDMPPGFDKSSSGATDDTRESSPDRRSSPDKMELKRSPPAHPPPPMSHPPPIDMPPLPKRPSVPSVPTHPPPPASSKHLCGVCRKNFSSSSALQIHMRTHTGDKPFRCAVCQKAFTTKGNLKVHMGTHMWSGGASRRGRRMSLELPPRPLHEPHDLLRRPDLFYPYLPAPFLNGMQQKLNEISVIQQSAGQNGVAAKFPGLLGFGAFGGGRPGAASPLERPPSLEGGDERQAAMRELAERGRELAERSRQMREEGEYRSPPAHAPHPPPPAQPSPPAPHHQHPHPLASLPPPARTEGLTV
ncbi:homeotic protein spalt-major-like isoform X2 [Plodia interpunctella]|uniref:homeotic protein spalt-major-like isoform X2 n=1 Tax=Plodia interpunctella TaxID=58824 RepID=UPI0023684C8F|nr:homeotic protein spalt-major-like isoform X2 [Plodia interpunctella]